MTSASPAAVPTPSGTMACRLARARRVMRLSATALGLLWWLAICLGIWLALFLLDNLLKLPAGLRFPFALGAMGLTAAGFVVRIVLPALRRPRVERTAVLIERQHAVPDNLIINAVQLETQPLSTDERAFAQATIGASDAALSRIPAGALWRSDRLRRWGLYAALVAVGWGVYAGLLPRHVGNAFARYASPLDDIAPVSATSLGVTPDSDVTVCEGDSLDVRATVSTARLARGAAAPIPAVVWREGCEAVAPSRQAGEAADMRPPAAPGSPFAYTFRMVRRSFAFRVLAGDTYSRCVRVTVLPAPRVRASLFRVTPPAYTGRPVEESPGPPASVSGLPWAGLEIRVEFDRQVSSPLWGLATQSVEFLADGGAWTARTTIEAAGNYVVSASDGQSGRRVTLAEGEVGVKADQPPRIDFATGNRNRFVAPGTLVELDVEASDDYGLRRIEIASRRIEESEPLEGVVADGSAAANALEQSEAPAEKSVLKTWPYLGPPGHPGPVKERLSFSVDPARYAPGATYLVEALGYDFSPAGAPGRSQALILRVKSWQELTVPSDDALARAFERLKQTIEEQQAALSLTEALQTHADEAMQGRRVPAHRDAMDRQQRKAQALGREAQAEFGKQAEGQRHASRLDTLSNQEMAWVLRDVARVASTSAVTSVTALAAALQPVSERQRTILAELIALLGQLASERAGRPALASEIREEEMAPALTMEDAARQLKDDLEAFTRVQRRLIKATTTLMDKPPEDLTTDEERILGDLAREEAKWAQFFEEKLQDFSKLPLQDFADGALAEEFNEVFQEIKLAAKSLYEQKIEMAVPQEQSGLERAEELIHNLERWLPDIPDNLKWKMEEPPAPFDIPLAELPRELEDIVGELLDREQDMTEEVEDLTSSWMDSVDKGAGWDAFDGPISSMSAKGVTGNLLPNQQEIGGRAGEGRTGRSHGQMVEEEAEGKAGRQTPTRLTPSPFEPGSVKDSSKEGTGGATGGGKLSGFTEAGLRGPTPPPRLDQMARLADRQSAVRQDAERLALRLRAYHLPTGDLEGSVEAMKKLEESAKAGEGLGVRHAFSRVVEALDDARGTVRAAVGLHRESSSLTERSRGEILTGLREGTPEGYEEMTAEYFRVLAEQGTK